MTMSSEEACLAKYAHNVFGCLKVTYFNCIHDLCKQHKLDYNNVLSGILVSGYINDTHTKVPGPDGKFGYGGKCFPKDIEAFKTELDDSSFAKLLTDVAILNSKFRNAIS